MAIVAQGQELIMIFTASGTHIFCHPQLFKYFPWETNSVISYVLIRSVILMILLVYGNDLVFVFQFYDRLNVRTGHYTPLPCGSAPLKRSLRDYMS